MEEFEVSLIGGSVGVVNTVLPAVTEFWIPSVYSGFGTGQHLLFSKLLWKNTSVSKVSTIACARGQKVN